EATLLYCAANVDIGERGEWRCFQSQLNPQSPVRSPHNRRIQPKPLRVFNEHPFGVISSGDRSESRFVPESRAGEPPSMRRRTMAARVRLDTPLSLRRPFYMHSTVNPRVRAALFAILTFALPGSAALAQLPALIPRETLFGNPERVSPKLSPDGKT